MPITSIPTRQQMHNYWLKLYKQTILWLKLWKWAAVKHPKFKHFEIGFSKIIHITAVYSHYSGEFFVMRIALNKPNFYTFIPWTAIGEFLKAHDLPADAIDDDVPF